MMRSESAQQTLKGCLDQLTRHELSSFDFLPEDSPAEKLINLVLAGPPDGISEKLAGLFHETLTGIREVETEHLRVVILGGGTGLSNIVGGDSRKESWVDDPFTGLKEIFPGITSIVCVTDDGGSTGELLKDLPFVALGDLRHVLLSSVRRKNLRSRFGIDFSDTLQVARVLYRLFNHRFDRAPASAESLLAEPGFGMSGLPRELVQFIEELVQRIFSDDRLRICLQRPHCLGNLLLASAIFAHVDPVLSSAELAGEQRMLHDATLKGLADIAEYIGAADRAVLPCTTTPAQLQVLYANGVLVTGEDKSGSARREYPVDRTFVGFLREPVVPQEVEQALQEADIIILAPGSLYSSIIPILQVPGIADTIRQNQHALKILVSNIWVQKGETDATRDAPERKFHVSDLVRAYKRNIPGGVDDLFTHILTLGMGDISGSILRNYALEDKEPIYLDRHRLRQVGFEPVEAGIFSTDLLRRFRIIQHDPEALASAVRTLWCLQSHESSSAPGIKKKSAPAPSSVVPEPREPFIHPCQRFKAIHSWLDTVSFQYFENGAGKKCSLDAVRRGQLRERIAGILWNHPDILLDHLKLTSAVTLVASNHWSRCQQWDNVFSFYDPDGCMICIREDQADIPSRFEMAFLVALGQSLLGNYAARKIMLDVSLGGEVVGRAFQVTLRDEQDWKSYFNVADVDIYLRLARMGRLENGPGVYSRLVNSDEGFTPPGLLFGLFYAWYLDNRFASNIEYKMSILRHTVSDLIPEQIKIVGRREGLVNFFRKTVFKHRFLAEGCR